MSDNAFAAVIIVIGAHPRAEAGDRPLAYRVRSEIERWKDKHAEALGTNLGVLVCTDLWYMNDEALRQRPTICIGGPGVNALSAYLAEHLSETHAAADVLMQLDEDFTDLRVILWGRDHGKTVHGVELFLDKFLDAYLRAVATQVEPEG
ncbi:MAG: hypothetical protein AAF328_06130 [Planctomycetota bacterium]